MPSPDADASIRSSVQLQMMTAKLNKKRRQRLQKPLRTGYHTTRYVKQITIYFNGLLRSLMLTQKLWFKRIDSMKTVLFQFETEMSAYRF